MKKLIISIILLVAVLCHINSQTLAYKPYAQFNGDIASYLQYNFDDRGNLYQGKTIADLLKDIEIKPLGYERAWAESKLDNIDYVRRIDLYFTQTIPNECHPTKDFFLSIAFDTPFPNDLLKNLEKQYPSETWVSQHYNFFKDKTIKIVKYRML